VDNLSTHNPVGLKSWNGRARLKEETIHFPGAAEGFFKKDNKTYSSSFITTEIPNHWNQATGKSPVIITFHGNGELRES
jgi:hypothetical protein